MRILLTGASGFIGSAVLKLAVSQGHEVAALIRPERLASFETKPCVQWLGGTLAAAPWDQIAAFGPEICIHAAWLATPGIYLESPENDRLLEWSEAFVRRAVESGVRRAVALGTCIEYQITGGALSEEITPLAPVSRYARCKDALRRRLEAAAAKDGFSFNWGRVFHPYGPGEHPARLCSSVIRQLRDGKPLVLEHPDSMKDYIFIDDLAAAILAVAGSHLSGAINLGTGVGVSVREIARTIADLLGRPDLVHERALRDADPFGFVVADAHRLRELGWRPYVTLRQGLELLLQLAST